MAPTDHHFGKNPPLKDTFVEAQGVDGQGELMMPKPEHCDMGFINEDDGYAKPIYVPGPAR